MEKLLSVDGSTTNTGVAVFKITKSGKTFQKCKVITPPEKSEFKYKAKDSKKVKKEKKQKAMEYRVDYMIHSLFVILQAEKIDHIIMEDAYCGTDPNTLKWLSRLQGAVIGFAIANDIDIIFKHPTKWRKELGMANSEGVKKLKREELKAMSVAYVKDKYGIDVTDDCADAICLGETY